MSQLAKIFVMGIGFGFLLIAIFEPYLLMVVNQVTNMDGLQSSLGSRRFLGGIGGLIMIIGLMG